MAVDSVSSSRQALVSDDKKVTQRREVVKDGDRKESDDRAVRAQDDKKGRRIDTEA